MRIKKNLLFFAKLLIAVAVVAGLNSFCQTQTKGFRPYLLISNLPNDPRWEVPPLAKEEQQHIDALLDQPFTYLASGGWCIAFLGADQKTVLKFFKHTHLQLPAVLRAFSFEKLLLKSAPWPSATAYFQEFNFNSCTLLYKEAKERTGLLYLHLNKTEGMHKLVTLTDNIGIKHTIALDKTEFVVQKKAELLLLHIDRLAKDKKHEEAKRCLDDMIGCLLTLYTRGVRDLDQSLRCNFGFTDEGAITLDLSSFEQDDSLKRPGNYRKEVLIKTRQLARFLRKNHKELHLYFEERLSQLMEEG